MDVKYVYGQKTPRATMFKHDGQARRTNAMKSAAPARSEVRADRVRDPHRERCGHSLSAPFQPHLLGELV